MLEGMKRGSHNSLSKFFHLFSGVFPCFRLCQFSSGLQSIQFSKGIKAIIISPENPSQNPLIYLIGPKRFRYIFWLARRLMNKRIYVRIPGLSPIWRIQAEKKFEVIVIKDLSNPPGMPINIATASLLHSILAPNNG